MRGATRWVVMAGVGNGIAEIGKAWAIQVVAQSCREVDDVRVGKVVRNSGFNLHRLLYPSE